ncbi:unnamed protein product [Rotaria sp. Silwood2]|nr:unnamed protein product [Rotaria sp. Silwood2]
MKSRLKIKQREVLSSSSDDSDKDNEMKSTASKDSLTLSPKRSSSQIRIRRLLSSSSSEELNKNNAVAVKHSKKAKLEIKDKNNATSSQNQKKTKRNNRTKNKEKDSSTKRKTGRKNIRKIIHDKDLNVKTKYAIEVERQRRKRLANIQKLYNNTLLRQSSFIPNSKSYKSEKSNLRLILEFDKKTNKSNIEVSPKLVAHLKKHQYDGIKFLWNNVYESIDAIKTKKQNTNGCILAHCMGLGKTLQVISFIHTVFNYSHITKIKTCLVLSPVNAALNWSNEFNFWLKDIEPSINHYQLTIVEPDLRVEYLNKWHENGGVLIIGYQMYERLVKGIGIKNKKIQIDAYHCLVDPGPDIVGNVNHHCFKDISFEFSCLVADEGHILKNAQTSIANCLSKIKTSRRIVLTGTPLQNNLLEYYCMVSFVKPNLLGDRDEYKNRFVNPIENGQHSNSNEPDVYLMKKRAYVLHELLTGFVDRKDHSLLKEYLPPKFEYIINIRLSPLQSRLYYLYLQIKVTKTQRSPRSNQHFKSAKLFADYQYLHKIWTHPFLLYPYFINRWKKGLEKNDDRLNNDNELEDIFRDDNELETVSIDDEENKSPLENNLNDFSMNNIQNEVDEYQSLTSATIDSDSSSTDSDEYIDIGKDDSTQSRSSSTTVDSSETDIENNKNYNDDENENSIKPWLNQMRKEFWFDYLDSLSNQSEFDVELSGKILLLKFIIDKCAEIGDRILVFSRSLYSLNYIENFLKHLQIQNEKKYQTLLLEKNNHSIPTPVQWVSEKDYFRIDGKTKILLRKIYIETFNNPSNSRARLFLISTTAGGIGINLSASNRIIIFDASWNPSNDAQALFRSYRFGQKKPLYVYRFVSHGTMEEKIYRRQVVKQSLSKRVVDGHQIDRHFTRQDIKELYDFQLEELPKAQSTSTYPTESNTNLNSSEPEDRLLFDLLNEHKHWIYSYHSHDSLLENKIDENLSPEEQSQALEEYESLKQLPIQRQSSSQCLPPQHSNSLVTNNTVNHNIPVCAKWKRNGVTIVGDHRECNDIDKIYWPVDLFVHDDETIIFTDWANERVVRYNMSSKNKEVVAGGNRTDSQLNSLSGPINVLMDKTTNSLIICDRGNRRVIRQSCQHDITKTEILVNDVACRGLAMDDQGFLYVADHKKHEVKRYRIGDKEGTIVAGGSGQGNGLHQLNKPRHVFIDKKQSIYVSDSGNHRVVKWGKYAKKGIIVAGGHGKGKSWKQLSFPYGLFVDALGTVYVADSRNDRVMRWLKGAKFGTVVVGGNGRGAKANQFHCPSSLSFDQYGNLYVADCWNQRIQRFSIDDSRA